MTRFGKITMNLTCWSSSCPDKKKQNSEEFSAYGNPNQRSFSQQLLYMELQFDDQY